jgi:hypothetical protein
MDTVVRCRTAGHLDALRLEPGQRGGRLRAGVHRWLGGRNGGRRGLVGGVKGKGYAHQKRKKGGSQEQSSRHLEILRTRDERHRGTPVP